MFAYSIILELETKTPIRSLADSTYCIGGALCFLTDKMEIITKKLVITKGLDQFKVGSLWKYFAQWMEGEGELSVEMVGVG